MKQQLTDAVRKHHRLTILLVVLTLLLTVGAVGEVAAQEGCRGIVIAEIASGGRVPDPLSDPCPILFG